jgi:hypothetical protein
MAVVMNTWTCRGSGENLRATSRNCVLRSVCTPKKSRQSQLGAMKNVRGQKLRERGEGGYTHLDAVGKSFLRSPYVGMYRFNGTPRASFRWRMSHLLRKRINCTYTPRRGMSVSSTQEHEESSTLASSFDLQIEVQKFMLSSSRLGPVSPSSLSSNTDIGARKMIALTSVK